jgi:hypothetical protein
VSFAEIARVADAVLLEGYVLYPYRATSAKNRYRWTFGVLAPRAWSENGGCEPWWLEAQVLIEGDAPRLRGRLRFLRVVARSVETRDGERWRRVERLEVDGRSLVAWEEGEITEIDFDAPGETFFALETTKGVEPVRDRTGAEMGRVVRERVALAGRIEARFEQVTGSDSGRRLSRIVVRVENLAPFANTTAERSEAVRAALVSTHLLLEADRGELVSLIDPPPYAAHAAARCVNVGTNPVLAGRPGSRDVVLSSPIVLYDHPAIAPESPGDFFDACEIDELLALRTRTLTSEERELARATDPRAAEIVDRALALTDEQLERLHGVIRERDSLAAAFPVGSRVRLRPDPHRRRTDAQDLLIAGRSATVEAIRRDVDGREYLAVTLDDDPAVEMHRAKGRFHFYYPDEVESL